MPEEIESESVLSDEGLEVSDHLSNLEDVPISEIIVVYET